jgi:hypothetical protein
MSRAIKRVPEPKPVEELPVIDGVPDSMSIPPASAVLHGLDRADLGKVMVNDQTPRCPFCKSTLIQPSSAASGTNAFSNMFCTNCRKQFRPGPLRLEKTA